MLIFIIFKEYEPHCGELLCRSFDLNDIVKSQHIVNDENFLQKAYEDINRNLGSIIAKSKKRHIELAERSKRRERNSRSKSSSRDREGDTYDSNSSQEDRGSSKRSHDTKGENAHLINETYSYNNTNNNYRYRNDYYSQNQSYRYMLMIVS